MRRTIAWRALLVFDGVRHLRVNVLDEGSTARHIQHLHAEADREDRNSSSFGGSDDQQIGFVFDGLDPAKVGMRFVAGAQRIHVGVPSGKQYALELLDDGVDVLRFWDQADVYRKPAGGLD